MIALIFDRTWTHLCASFVRAATAVRGSEAEAAGAALRVGRVQVERTDITLITAQTLDILLRMEATG